MKLKPFLLSSLFVFIFTSKTYAQGGYISILGGINRGEHIFETGNKYPNLSGITGGSRITYSRDFNFAGIDGGYFTDHLNLKLKTTGTGWYINPGNSRDEDFTLTSNSQERGEKFIPEKGMLYDTAYTYSGTRNFADGHTKTSMKENKMSFDLRYYFSSGSADPSAKIESFFLNTGFHYQFSKYHLYDVMQFINSRPIFYSPIGQGLSYSFNAIEIPLGMGYSTVIKDFRVELEISYLVSYLYARDFHIQRALNFLSKSTGPGFLYKLDITYTVSENTLFKISTSGHRHFTSGIFKTRGGLYESDILSNYSGTYKSYLSTKEMMIEFALTRTFIF